MSLARKATMPQKAMPKLEVKAQKNIDVNKLALPTVEHQVAQVSFKKTIQAEEELQIFQEEMKKLVKGAQSPKLKSSLKNKRNSDQQENQQDENYREMDRIVSMNAQEAQIRNVIHEMVTPIIDLAKRNIEHNAKKNEKFIELFTKCEELKAVTQNNHREIQEIRRSQKEIQDIKKDQNLLRVESKGKLDAQDFALKKIQMRFDELDQEKLDNLKIIETRDVQFVAIEERFEKLQSSTIQTLEKFQQQVNHELHKYSLMAQNLSDEFKDTKQMVQAIKTITMANEEKQLGLNFRLDLLKKEIEELKIQEIAAIQARIEDCRQMNFQNNVTINEVNINIRKLSDRHIELTNCYQETRDFVSKTIPVLTYFQLSDMMQEFLCLPDQAKLIRVDNERLQELMMNQLDYENLKIYTDQIVLQCLSIGKGLGRFELGKDLDIDYLNNRENLLKSHNQTYLDVKEKQPSKLHMGCLNGTVLKEVRVYTRKQLKPQSIRYIKAQNRPKYYQKSIIQQNSEKSLSPVPETTKSQKAQIIENSAKSYTDSPQNQLNPIQLQPSHQFQHKEILSVKSEEIFSELSSSRQQKQRQNEHFKSQDDQQNQLSQQQQIYDDNSTVDLQPKKIIIQKDEPIVVNKNESLAKINQQIQLIKPIQIIQDQNILGLPQQQNVSLQQISQKFVNPKQMMDSSFVIKQKDEESIKTVSAATSSAPFSKSVTMAGQQSNVLLELKIKDLEGKLMSIDSTVEKLMKQMAGFGSMVKDHTLHISHRMESAMKETQEALIKSHKQHQEIAIKINLDHEQKQKQLQIQFNNVFQEMQTQFKEHNNEIQMEYIEFFKSRQKIRTEWSQYSTQTCDQLEKLARQVKQYEDFLVLTNANDSILSDIVLQIFDFTFQQKYDQQFHKRAFTALGDIKNNKNQIDVEVADMRSKIRFKIDQIYKHSILNCQQKQEKVISIENQKDDQEHPIFDKIKIDITSKMRKSKRKLSRQLSGIGDVEDVQPCGQTELISASMPSFSQVATRKSSYQQNLPYTSSLTQIRPSSSISIRHGQNHTKSNFIVKQLNDKSLDEKNFSASKIPTLPIQTRRL